MNKRTTMRSRTRLCFEMSVDRLPLVVPVPYRLAALVVPFGNVEPGAPEPLDVAAEEE